MAEIKTERKPIRILTMGGYVLSHTGSSGEMNVIYNTGGGVHHVETNFVPKEEKADKQKLVENKQKTEKE